MTFLCGSPFETSMISFRMFPTYSKFSNFSAKLPSLANDRRSHGQSLLPLSFSFSRIPCQRSSSGGASGSESGDLQFSGKDQLGTTNSSDSVETENQKNSESSAQNSISDAKRIAATQRAFERAASYKTYRNAQNSSSQSLPSGNQASGQTNVEYKSVTRPSSKVTDTADENSSICVFYDRAADADVSGNSQTIQNPAIDPLPRNSSNTAPQSLSIISVLSPLDSFSLQSRLVATETTRGELIQNDTDAPKDMRKSAESKALSAFEKTEAYMQQQAEMIGALQDRKEKYTGIPGAAEIRRPTEENVVEIEIHTRQGVIKRKALTPQNAFSNVKERKRAGVSGLDFAGLGFSDKRQPGNPAGLYEGLQPPSPDVLPQVDIITRDAGKAVSENSVEGILDDLYKPRVSTWGVFPRPADISKRYGGGRNIRPGQTLETEEEKQVREARTKQLLANYKRKMGLDMDPKLKAECENELKQGYLLMEGGKLQEALVSFDRVMNGTTFQSELHGLAALQIAVCLDSLTSEARMLYEKLLSHSNQGVRKQARRFLYGFQAMEDLKVTGSKWDPTAYEKYFRSFPNAYNGIYPSGTEESKDNLLEQALPYLLFLLLPIFMVFALATKPH